MPEVVDGTTNQDPVKAKENTLDKEKVQSNERNKNTTDEGMTFEELLEMPEFKSEYDRTVEKLLNRKKEEWSNNSALEVQKIRAEAQSEIANLKIENALSYRGVDREQAMRLSGLVKRENIVGEKGTIDEKLLEEEISAIFKTFPSLSERKTGIEKGFSIGADGKEEKKEDSQSLMRKVMGLK